MTTRRLRHLLWLTATSMTLIAVGILMAAFLIKPSQHAIPLEVEDTSVASTSKFGAPALPDRSGLLALAEYPLRQELFDPPPPLPEQAPPPPALPRIELISTVLSSRAAPSAWIREPGNGNSPRRVRVGDVLGTPENPVTITAIEPNRLLVEHNGEVKTIDRDGSAEGRRR